MAPTPQIRPALTRRPRPDPVGELLSEATDGTTVHEQPVRPKRQPPADTPAGPAAAEDPAAPTAAARPRRARRGSRSSARAPELPGRVRGNQREVSLNLSGRARSLLEAERRNRGAGLSEAAVEALAAQLAGIVNELAETQPEPDVTGDVFPVRRGAARRRQVEQAQRVGLYLRPAEVDALDKAARNSGASMSHLVTDAVERHFGHPE